MLNVHKIHPGDSSKLFLMLPSTQSFFRGCFRICFPHYGFKSVALVWSYCLTLILILTLSLFFFRVLLGFLLPPPNSRHLSLLHLSKRATISQEKAQTVLLSTKQGGQKLQNQNELDTTANTWTQPFALVFIALHPGFLKLDLHIRLWENKLCELPKPPFLWLAPVSTAVGGWVWKRERKDLSLN